MHRRAFAALVLAAAGVAAGGAVFTTGAGAAASGPVRQYVVLAEQTATPAAVRTAVVKSGGRVVTTNRDIGLYTVVSRNPNFVRVATATRAIRSAGRSRAIGSSRVGSRDKYDHIARSRTVGVAKHDRNGQRPHRRQAEPLADLQWDMQMIHATREGSYAEQAGRRKVLVGDDRQRDRRHPPRHRPELRQRASAATSRSTSPDRQPVRGRGRRVVQRPCERRRGRPRHARGGDDWRRDQRTGHRGRRSQGHAREPARRAGQRASSSCSPRSMRSPTRPTTASTWST